MKFFCLNKNCFFIKETDTFGHIVVWTIYTSHIDHFTPKRTAIEQSTTCFVYMYVAEKAMLRLCRCEGSLDISRPLLALEKSIKFSLANSPISWKF